MPHIEEFYVITETGICIYAHTLHNEIDENLFAGFMTALNQFSMSWSSESLNAFRLGQAKYTILSQDKLLFVARTSIKAKEKALRKELQEMVEIFQDRAGTLDFSAPWESTRDAQGELNDALNRFLLPAEDKMHYAIW